MSKIEQLRKQISQAQDAYYNGSAIIDDDEYDALLYELSLLEPNDELLKKVGAKASSKEWEKEQHLFPLGSLDKVNFPNEMQDWVFKTLNNKETIVSEKLDGLSLGCRYEDGKLISAVLRADGLNGENILQNVLKMNGCIKSLHQKFSGVIRGEIVLLKSNHQKYFKDYSNPRNAASGICRRFDGQGCEHLTFMAYDVLCDNYDDFNIKTESDKFKFLKENDFIVPSYNLCKSSKDVNDIWQEYQDKIRAELDHEIDGLVVCCNDLQFCKSLGETNLKPKYKLAFKFANQFIKTTVKKVEWTVGLTGRITPVCWFDKVYLLGSEIEKASVYNISNIKNIGLTIGSDILVCKGNDIIPKVEKVITKTSSEVIIPTECPQCKSSLEMNGEYLQCPNITNCPGQKIGRLIKWVSELNLLELGDTLLERLISTNMVEDVADLYELSIEQLASLDRMGEKSATNVYNSLWKTTNLKVYEIIGALNIPLIGTSTAKLVFDAGYDTLDKLYCATQKNLSDIKGMGDVRAASLANGLKNNKSLIDKLLKNGITIKDNVLGKLSNKNICFTGKMQNKRNVLEKMAKDAGANVKSSVGKDTHYLVINDESGSSKATSAKKFGTICISENDFLDLIK